MRKALLNITMPVLALAAALLLIQCSHPYEEGMSGAFPSFEILSGGSITMPASGTQQQLTGEIRIKTNLKITAKVNYQGSSTSWISNLKISYDEAAGTAGITFQASRNTKRSERRATVAISPQSGKGSIYVTVTQSGYTSSGADEVYDGDLYIRSQEDVENFIYTGVNGRLIIGDCVSGGHMASYSDPGLLFVGSDIYDISNLEMLEYVQDGIVIVSCNNLYGISSLDGVASPMIELTDLPSEAAQSYNGSASEVYIIQNSGNFSTLGFISDMGNVRKLVMNGNFIDSIEGLENAAFLEELDLSGNSNLSNINTLAEIPGLKSADLSGLDISQSQINYVSAVRPDMEISANDITGNTFLTISIPEDGITSWSVQIQFGAYNIHGITEAGIVYAISGNAFDFSSRCQISESINSDTEYIFEADVTPDTYYSFWTYVTGSDGSIHLSEKSEEIYVPAELRYSLTADFVFPKFSNIEETPAASSMTAYVFKKLEDLNSTTESCQMQNTGGNSWVFSTTPGLKNILFTNREPDSRLNIMSSGDESDIMWGIEQTGTEGTGDDILAAAVQFDLSQDDMTSVTLIRPASRIDIGLEIRGNFDIGQVSSIEATIDNCCSGVNISSLTGELSYYGNTANTFTGDSWSDRTIFAATDRYIFPNVEGTVSTISFNLGMADGRTVSLQGTLDEPLSANSDYSILFYVTWNSADGTFTVDEIETVEDTIEF